MTLSSLILVRALAILLVVVHHSKAMHRMHGGLNALIVVSGISMAMFAFGGSTPQTLRSFGRFGLRLAVPTFCVALASGLLQSDIRWQELAFISNWISTDRVVLFPFWYVQAMVQLLIALSVVFWVLDLTPKIRAAPVRTTAWALALSVLVCLASYALWDTRELKDKLPHLVAWNFVFGWFYWAMTSRGRRSLRARIILTATLLACEIPIYLIADSDHGAARFRWLTILGCLLIWREEIRLPIVPARILALVSQASFWIFLLHRYGFLAARKLGDLLGVEALSTPPVLILFGVVLPVLTWAWFTACSRTLKRMRRELAQPAS